MDWLTIKENIKDIVKYALIVIVLLFVIQYVVSISTVVGSSMSPTLNSNELVLVNKIKYRFQKVKRGDIISLHNVDTKYLIKRVIGLPGDYISIKDNKLYINNQLYDEPYLPKDIVYSDFDLNELNYTVIPDGMYFVLGDNRPDSLDSRKIGLIKQEEIIGKISLRFWPLSKIKLF